MSSSATAGAGSGLDGPLGVSPVPSCPLSRVCRRCVSTRNTGDDCLTSGSCPTFPTKITLFTLFAVRSTHVVKTIDIPHQSLRTAYLAQRCNEGPHKVKIETER